MGNIGVGLPAAFERHLQRSREQGEQWPVVLRDGRRQRIDQRDGQHSGNWGMCRTGLVDADPEPAQKSAARRRRHKTMQLPHYAKKFGRLMRAACRLRADERGVAAIEFGLVATFLTFSVLNVADISIYVYQRMEVENATEMGAA